MYVVMWKNIHKKNKVAFLLCYPLKPYMWWCIKTACVKYNQNCKCKSCDYSHMNVACFLQE